MPSAVLFDLFATLAVEDFAPLVRQECELLGVSTEAFDAANRSTRPQRSRTPDPIEGTSMLLDALGVSTDHASEIFEMQASWLGANGRLYDDAFTTLTDLRRRGIKTAVICNGSPFVRRWLDINGLVEAADVVILSAEERVAKPEAAIFRLACDRLGVAPGPLCWFVDDQPAYLVGAFELGIRCWQITRPGTAGLPPDHRFTQIAELSALTEAVVNDGGSDHLDHPSDGLLVACHNRLLADLARVTEILRRATLDHWAEWMAADSLRIESGDAAGLTHLLSAYGGMGSFNDVVIDPRNGHPVSDAEADRLDHELVVLRSRIWQDATVLRRAYSI